MRLAQATAGSGNPGLDFMIRLGRIGGNGAMVLSSTVSTLPNSYSNWSEGEPNNDNNEEDCALLIRESPWEGRDPAESQT